MMMGSREALVNYITTLGLHHIMARNHHTVGAVGRRRGRADWTSVYYHRADTISWASTAPPREQRRAQHWSSAHR
jgi:alpha-glucuronidase